MLGSTDTLGQMRCPLLLFPLLLAACAVPPPAPVGLDAFAVELGPGEIGIAPATFQDAPDFSLGWYERESLAQSIGYSLAYLAKPSSKQFYPMGPITHKRMVATLERFLVLLESSASAEEFGMALHDEFEVWSARGRADTGEVLFTGYCRPILQGSRKQRGEFQHPLYHPPKDLARGADGKILGRKTPSGRIVPYWTRNEIRENKILEGKEFIWLNDPFDAYIAQVQGSALIQLEDGSFLEAGYDGTNGRDYQSVGAVLLREGLLKKGELSLSSIRDFFRRNPKEVNRVLGQNPRFVFFQESEGGPFGCLGQPVLPMRSVATDKNLFPRAGLVFCETRLPGFDEDGNLVQRPMRFFACDQDRGGAIRSAGRCDVFLGTGDDAVARAGHVLSVGRMHYLFLRDS